jgi:hypothetical protein
MDYDFLRRHTFIISLFGYEVENGRSSDLWDNPGLFFMPAGAGGKGVYVPMNTKKHWYDAEFSIWMNNKRSFTEDEVISGVWVAIAENGYTSLIYLHKNGDLTEKPVISKSKNEWGGSWKLEDDILRITIDKYVTYVIASKEEPIHSAMQFISETANMYFKFIHAL